MRIKCVNNFKEGSKSKLEIIKWPNLQFWKKKREIMLCVGIALVFFGVCFRRGEFGLHTPPHEEHGDAIDEGLTLSSPKWL